MKLVYYSHFNSCKTSLRLPYGWKMTTYFWNWRLLVFNFYIMPIDHCENIIHTSVFLHLSSYIQIEAVFIKAMSHDHHLPACVLLFCLWSCWPSTNPSLSCPVKLTSHASLTTISLTGLFRILYTSLAGPCMLLARCSVFVSLWCSAIAVCYSQCFMWF